jgi:chemotaxis protein MotB
MIRRPAFRPPAPSPAAGGIWLISFADLVSLMLAFFVLMFAMREPEPKLWADLLGRVTAPSTAARPALPGDPPPQPRASFNIATTEEISARSLDYLSAVLRNQLSARPALAGLAVVRQDDRLTLFAPATLLFDGGLSLSARGRETLYLLAPMLGRAGNRVEVVGRASAEEGRSESGQADGGRGWERALTQAVVVAQGLRDAGYQTDLVARGVLTDMVLDGEAGVELVIREEEAGRP